MKTKPKTHLTKALILVSIAAGMAAAGCELIVDFDRTRIPVEAVDAGDFDGAILGDGAVAPTLDSGGSDGATEASTPDAGADASDASDASDAHD